MRVRRRRQNRPAPLLRAARRADPTQKWRISRLLAWRCEGTGIGTTLKFYLTRRQPPNDPHGRGPVLLAGAEILISHKN